MGYILTRVILFGTIAIVAAIIRSSRNSRNENEADNLIEKIYKGGTSTSLLDENEHLHKLISQMDVFYAKRSFFRLDKLTIEFPNESIDFIENKITYTVKDLIPVNDLMTLIIISCKVSDFTSNVLLDNDVYVFKFKVVLDKEKSCVEIYSDLYEDSVRKNMRKQFIETIFNNVIVN